MEEIFKIILGFISGSGIGVLLFYRIKRRKENADATVVEHNAYLTQITYLKTQLKESFTELDNMQDIIDKKRKQIIELTKRLGELEIKLVETEQNRQKIECNVCLNDRCKERMSLERKNYSI